MKQPRYPLPRSLPTPEQIGWANTANQIGEHLQAIQNQAHQILVALRQTRQEAMRLLSGPHLQRVQQETARLNEIYSDLARQERALLTEKMVWDRKLEPHRTRKDAERDCGYVYLMLAASGLYKIGKARDPEERLKQVAKKAGQPVFLVHAIFAWTPFKAERELHARFAERHRGHEWFDLTQEQVAWILTITEL